MAETKSAEEATLSGKRKANLISQDLDSSSLKAPKLVAEEKIEHQEGNHTAQSNNLGISGNNDSSDDDADDEKSGEVVNAAPQVDRKGKGILIEEEEEEDEMDDDDDDDDSSDGLDDSDGESDLSDDPLAEVDLDNWKEEEFEKMAEGVD